MEHFAENILASSIVLLAFLIILGLGCSFVVWKNSKKKTDATANFLKNLHAGQQVKTSSGIYGVVKTVKKETVDVELAPNVVVTFDRWALIAVSQDSK
ncbi:MAG: preprotein translocase subunit YajC [Atopobiaceae bacterium]|nr:preprotein translocase subunit YajC [Atopobiaceae bacterium]